MGKLTGLIQFTGKLDGLSFYESRGKIIVRKTGGFEGKKIKHAPQYVRVRENSQEFSQSASAGKYLRVALREYLAPLRIPYVHNRVVQLFQALTKLDTQQERGHRKVRFGLATNEGVQLLRAFELDPRHPFDHYFPFSWTLSQTEGTLHVVDFDPSRFPTPVGASHVDLQLIWLGLDFDTRLAASVSASESVTFALNNTTVPTPILLSSTVPDCPTVLGAIVVSFWQVLNGERYRVQSGGVKLWVDL